jgi:hypothetical protein
MTKASAAEDLFMMRAPVLWQRCAMSLIMGNLARDRDGRFART